MTKRITSILLCIAMILGMMPIAMHTHAASQPVVSVEADNSIVNPGDTITFTVYLQSPIDIYGLHLYMDIPQGLTYVPESGAMVSGVKKELNATECAWTHTRMQITIGSAAPLKNIKDEKLAIATFKCTVNADAVGELAVTTITGTGGVYDINGALEATFLSAKITLDLGYVHNFTLQDKTSRFYNIQGKLSTQYGTVSYNGLTLTQCLKIDSDAEISFNAPSNGKLTLVFIEDAPTIRVDDAEVTGVNGVITVDITAGSHTLTKADTMNLYYMVYEPSSSSGDEHTHSYTESITTAATCTAAGVKTFTCSDCGDTYTEEIAALGHDEVDYEAKAATCTEIGWNAYIACSRCDYTTYEEISATGHSYSAAVTIPTCTADGYTTYTCTSCNYSYTADEVTATGHTYNGKVTTPATCEKPGTKTFTCDICGDSYTESIPALGGHNYTGKVTAPTCTAQGYTTYTCSTCGDAYEDSYTDATGHTEETVPGYAATCTEDGLTEGKKCSVCGETTTSQEVIPATGHSYSAAVTKPTCTVDGYTTYTCASCNHSYTADKVTAAGHSYTGKVTTNPTCTRTGVKAFTCSGCGDTYTEEIAALGHDEVDHEAKAATCTAIGWNAYVTCSRCDYTTYEELPVTGHSYTSNLTAPTCTAQGYTTHTCAACGATYKDSYTDAAGHTEVVDAAVAPTCTATGLTEGKHCDLCGEVLVKQDMVEALGHTGREAIKENRIAPTCTAPGSYDRVVYCAVCDAEISREYIAVDALGHKEEIVDGKEATCTETGLTAGKKCSVCGETTVAQTEIPAKNHIEEIIPSKEATCTATGLTEGKKCATCGEVLLAQVETAAKDHVEKILASRDPTCTLEGMREGTVCAVCGIVLSAQVTVPALGHTESETVVENKVEPDCTNDGSYDTVVYCSVCGDEVSRETTTVAARGHTEETVAGKAATCTATGLTEGKKCSVCGEITVKQDLIPVEAHTNGETVNENKKAATCTLAGSYDSVVYCSVCDAQITRETVTVKALGHDEVEHEAKAATCTAIGWDAYVTCSRCDYTTYKEIPATGHKADSTTYLLENADEYKHYLICGACDQKIEGEDHSFNRKGICTVCGYENAEFIEVADISGNYISWGEAENLVTIELIAEGETEASYQFTNVEAPANTGTWYIADVELGTYTVRVSKKNHVTREYTVVVDENGLYQDVEIWLLGDVNGDGLVNFSDYSKVLSQSKKPSSEILTGYAFQCGDVNADAAINFSDYSKVLSQAKGKHSLW